MALPKEGNVQAWGRPERHSGVSRVTEPAIQYGRYGYRWITAMLKEEGRQLNHERVDRIWKKEGLKVAQKQPIQAALQFSYPVKSHPCR